MARKLILIVCVTLFLSFIPADAFAQYYAPSNLSAQLVNQDNVLLQWDVPEPPYSILRWDSGVNTGRGVGLGDGGTFRVATRFTATELTPFDGMPLTSIEIYPREEATYTLKVWSGGSWSGTTGSSGTLLLSQPLTGLVYDDFNTITLTTPITIDATHELWFGYETTHAEGAYPAGCDDSPGVNCYGNLICFNNNDTWMTLSAAASHIDYNWNLGGYVTTGRGEIIPLAHLPVPTVQTPATEGRFEACESSGNRHVSTLRDRSVTSYKIYRDGVEIAENTDPNILCYSDENLSPATYEYFVTAVWYNTNESDPSNRVNATVDEIVYYPPENLTAQNVNIVGVQLQWDEPGTNAVPAESIEEGFEDGDIPEGWLNLDDDGDGYSWEIVTNNFGTHSGSYAIGSASYLNNAGALQPDNWLITPPVSIDTGYELSWWTAIQNEDWPNEHYVVLLSTGGTNPEDFTVELYEETLASEDWHEVCVDLSAYAGQCCYIAFEHCDVIDIDWMKLDDIAVNSATRETVLFLGSGAHSQLAAHRDDGNTSSRHILRNRPILESYNVYRSDDNVTFSCIGSQQNTIYTDANNGGGQHWYYVTAVYAGGIESGASGIVEVETIGTSMAGSGSEEDPFQVAALNHLLWISEHDVVWGCYFIQTANIDATDTQNWNNGEGFEPIGREDDYEAPFTGYYDGNHCTINNLFINRPTDCQGLFGFAKGETIANLGIVNANVTGGNNVGALVGKNGNTYSPYVTSTIYNCYSTGIVNGEDRVGGLVGSNSIDHTLNSCYSNVCCEGNWYVGGLMGELAGLGVYSSYIEQCYSCGTVNGIRNIGGLVGGTYKGMVINCYSMATIQNGVAVGGLVGELASSTIDKCYSVGYVEPGSWDGGLIGYTTSSEVNNSFWDLETSGQSSSGGGIGKTTLEMHSMATYTDAGWDFVDEIANGTDDYWEMDTLMNFNYPYLAWQEWEPDPPAIPQNVTVQFTGSFVLLQWDEVPRATSYKVYSSVTAEGLFEEDTTGVFDANRWIAPVSEIRKFYYVTSIIE